MQPIIHKAEIALDVNPTSVGISPGDRALLSLNQDATISVLVERPSRLPFGLGRPRLFAAGRLGTRATDLLRQAIESRAELRVRIVEVEPAHLNRSGHAAVFISVWGNPADLGRSKSKSVIFTRSKINDPISPQGGE